MDILPCAWKYNIRLENSPDRAMFRKVIILPSKLKDAKEKTAYLMVKLTLYMYIIIKSLGECSHAQETP